MTDPTALVALQQQASALFRAGRMGEAIPAYRRLLAARADLPNSWFNLALALRAEGQPHAALDAYDRALAYGIDAPEEVQLNRAVVFADDLGRSDEARAALEAALVIDPAFGPALLNLGNWHEDHGERDAARGAYRRARQEDPANVLALARLVGLTLPEEADGELLAEARAWLGAPGLSPLDRADLGFALGGALDRAGAYAEAFAAYANANRAMRADGAARGIAYDRAAQRQLTDRIVAAFPARRDAPPSDDDWAPIFIVGLFRSGSTLIERILARHSRVDAGGEFDLIPRFMREIADDHERAARLDAAGVATLRARYREAVAGRHEGSNYLTDKRPDNFLHLGLIKRLFPRAKIVVTSRDPLDNALSIYFLHADPALAYASDLGDIAAYVNQYRRLIAHWRTLYGDDMHVVDYDALVREPRAVLEPLFAFLGLPWEDAVLRDGGTGGAVRTASNWQVRQPLYQQSSGRWRDYATQLTPFRGLLDDGLERA